MTPLPPNLNDPHAVLVEIKAFRILQWIVMPKCCKMKYSCGVSRNVNISPVMQFQIKLAVNLFTMLTSSTHHGVTLTSKVVPFTVYMLLHRVKDINHFFYSVETSS